MSLRGEVVNKVLMVGSNLRELDRIENKLMSLKLNRNEVLFLKSRPGELSSFNVHKVDIIIYDLEEINSYSHQFFQKFSEAGFEGPIIVTARIPKHIDFDDFANMKQVHFLKNPMWVPSFLVFLLSF